MAIMVKFPLFLPHHARSSSIPKSFQCFVYKHAKENRLLPAENKSTVFSQSLQRIKKASFLSSFLVGFNVIQTKQRSYGVFPVSAVREDLRCPSMYYFRHEWAPE
jgi:hypothetical protein